MHKTGTEPSHHSPSESRTHAEHSGTHGRDYPTGTFYGFFFFLRFRHIFVAGNLLAFAKQPGSLPLIFVSFLSLISISPLLKTKSRVLRTNSRHLYICLYFFVDLNLHVFICHVKQLCEVSIKKETKKS